MRLLDGDQESQRVKFVALTFVGEDVGGMRRARVGVHTGSIRPLLGQCNVDLTADNKRECTEAIIRKKLKVRQNHARFPPSYDATRQEETPGGGGGSKKQSNTPFAFPFPFPLFKPILLSFPFRLFFFLFYPVGIGGWGRRL